MDILAHVLLSFALARAFFARAGWPVMLAVLAGGTLADADAFSFFLGPTAYLTVHHTFLHSLPGAVVVVVVSVAIAYFARRREPLVFSTLFLGAAFAAAVHLFLDLCRTDGITLLWPFRVTRISGDFISPTDVWIFGLLLAGILLPELFRMVNSEIGAKEKAPRGRNAAILVLALIVVYVGARAALHQRALSIMEAHTYRGESSRHSAAFPDPVSLLRWHSVLETSSTICQIEVPAGAQQRFDPEALNCLPKPEASAELSAAVATRTAKKLLSAVRFPRAAVQKNTGRKAEEYEIAIRSLSDDAAGLADRSVAARIILDSQRKVLEEELVWARFLRVR